MKTCDYLWRFIDKQLWLILEGTRLTENEKKEAETTINDIASRLGNSTSDTAQNKSSNCGIFLSNHQALWLLARLQKKISGFEPILLVKNARFESLLARLQAPENIEEDLRLLNDSVSNLLASDGREIVLPQPVNQFLQKCLLQGDLDAAISIINCLLSPYLSHLSALDSDLLKIGHDAISTLLLHEDLEPLDFAPVLLQLLSVTCDIPNYLLQVHKLTADKMLHEEEVYLALLSRKENPSFCLQTFCQLESHSAKEVLDKDGLLQVRAAFLRQGPNKIHWFMDYLDSLANARPHEADCENSESSNLGPILLFYLWASKTPESNVMLGKIELPQTQPFHRLRCLLQKRETVMKWIQKHQTHNVEVVLTAIHNLLQKYSTLNVLHQSGALLNSDWDNIQKLLEGGGQSGTSIDSWEITTFQGYCTMMRAINLFYNASKLSGENRPVDFKQYQENSLNIREELGKLQPILKKLYPLSFRLEILENIFSLLFVRYEHLKTDEVSSDSGGEDEDSLKSLATVTEVSLSPDLLSHHSMDQPDFPLPVDVQKEKQVTTPTRAQQRSGFLCGPLIIRDTLSFLKVCLIDCSSAIYKQKSSGEESVDADLQKKISIFSNNVTEAWWRLELITDISDVIDYEKKSKSYIPQPQRGYLSSASSSDSDSEQPTQLKTRRTQKSSRSDNTDKSSGSGSNTTGGFASSGSRGKKMGRRKSHALNMLPRETDSIVNVLLANPTSLALLCLSRGDYSKAQQVVQTYQLSNSEIAIEANFLEMFQTLAHEVSKTDKSSSAGNTFRDFATDMSPTNSKMLVSSSLELVRKAASIGISAVSVTSLVEKYLANAPMVPGMEKLMLENRQADMILNGINEKVLVSVDAAICLGPSSGASCSLMDVISQHIKFASMKPGVKGRGFAHFVTSFMELFRFICNKKKCGSSAEILATWDIPLTLPLLQDHLIFTLDLQSALSEYTSSDSPRCKVGSIRQMIKSLAECGNHFEYKGVREIGKETSPYLQHLFWYVQTLSFVLTRCSPETSTELSNPFELLSEGWECQLSRLIFELDAPLTRVERVANRLNLDLLQAIVVTCCPRFPQKQAEKEISSNQQPSASAWAKISLNAVTSQQDDNCDNCNALDLAAKLLSDLLAAVQLNDALFITSNDMPALSDKPEIIQILNETTKLSSINLGSLDEDHEKTAFLCNICNLLILHSLITLGHQSGLTSSSWSERRSAYNCIGYHLGQMGFVSLSGLLRQLVGPDFDNNLEAKSGGDLMWSLENKRALFAISHGTMQSPLVQVYDPERLDSQIQSSMKNYIMHNVRVEGSITEGCFTLVITPLILQFLGLSSPLSLDPAVEAQDEYLPPLPQQYMPDTSMAKDCAANIPTILEFLEVNVTGQLQLQLADWAAAWANSNNDTNELIIMVEDSSKKLGILLQSSMDVVNPDLLQSSLASEPAPKVEDWENVSIKPRVLQFLSKRCWIVALLAERLRRGAQEVTFWPHTESMDRYLGEKFVQLSSFGEGNLILGALKPPNLLLSKIWPILDKFIADQNDDECIQLMSSLPEGMVFDNVRLQTMRDLLFFYAASQSRRHGIEAPHRLALSLGTAELRAQCILKSIQFWSGENSIEALKAVLGDPKILLDTRKEALTALKKVVIYQQVHKVLCYYQPMKTSRSDGWHQILCLSDSDPGQVLQALIEAKQFRLCLQWAELHGVPSKANHLIDCNFVAPLLDTSDSANLSAAEKLLSSVPTPRAVSICRRLLASLTSMASLQFVVNFALKSCKSWLEQNSNIWGSLQLWSVGLSILTLQPNQEQSRDKALASKPHLLIEQLLMNTKLAVLSEALQILRTADLSAVPSDNASQPIAVDAMLRSYANKALDFRVAQRVVPEVTSPEPEDLLQSLSTGSTGSGPTPFVMPATPPTKSGWVPNDEVTDCMCCHLVPFSMFNRRHHCRRCGRVVCGSCSDHRMKVDGYGELQVRICDDCFIQMKQDTMLEVNKTAEPSVHSSQQTYIIEWMLTGDESQDETAREEFSFEHAPSVALCLSILGLHSEHAAAQPRFLLEAAEKMLQMLAPPTPGFVNPELDYSLVIRMARSLVVAAKVRYAKAALNSGVAHCDRLLGQVDLLSLLVKSGCANLLPVEPLPLSGHALRHLRDRLLTAELWSLALEVSTKAGLDRIGVWAAWGKACLRAGKWLEAREHLVHCLQPPVSTQDSASAPLLSEIIRILEESNYAAENVVMKQSEHIVSPALSVLHTLNSLNAIAQGKLSTLDSCTQTQPFYSECQYYLRTYGSPAASISFFLSHSDLASALKFIKDKAVEPDVFAEALYKPCLVQGLVGQMYKEMLKMDPTLDMWKIIIMHVGRLLEQQGLWNSLYQLQLFARDLVRAAMTCIRFYTAGARCYSDMSADQLIKARGHIEEELSSHWTGLKRSCSVSSGRSSESPDASETEFQIPLKLPARSLDHHTNTISRQLEAAKFLQQCETEDRTAVVAVSAGLSKMLAPSSPTNYIPTLFGDTNEKTMVAALILLCGKNIEEGFGITFRIIQYFRLKADKVYSLVAQQLVSAGKTRQIPQLVNCIQSSGSANATSCSDELVLKCIQKLIEQSDGLILAEPLLRLVNDNEVKIKAHLVCGFLKSAYLLAVKSGKVSDVKMILNEAEKLKQPAMRRICQQWLARKELKKNEG